MNIKANIGKIKKINFPPKIKTLKFSKSSSDLFSLKSKVSKNSKMKKYKEHNKENYSGTSKSLCRIKKNRDSIIVLEKKKIQ